MSPLNEQDIQRVIERVMTRLDGQDAQPSQAQLNSEVGRKIAIGADHGGYAMKQEIKTHLEGQGYQVVDCGTYSSESVDYPEFAEAVARKVAGKDCYCGIMIDGAGIGSCMAANKVPGVRAAMCYDHASAVNSREHNYANVLTLGAGMIGLALAKQIVDTWLTTPNGAERHGRRVAKIMAIESQIESH